MGDPFSNGENPFRDLPDENPYAAPSASTPWPPTTAPDGPNPLRPPGIILLTTSAVYLLLLLASLPAQLVRMRQIDPGTPEGLGELTGSLVTLVAWITITVAILLGSIAMIRLRSYRSAVTAAMASCIPCCSPCFLLGIPFGIWAFILLMRPEVRARFMQKSDRS